MCNAGDAVRRNAPSAGAAMVGARGASVSITNPVRVEGPALVPSAAVSDTERARPGVRSTPTGIASAQFQGPVVPVPAHVAVQAAGASAALPGPVKLAVTCSPGAHTTPPTSVLVARLKRRFDGKRSRVGRVMLTRSGCGVVAAERLRFASTSK